ncbi:MAG: 1-acyl-sn-glycerol-3-phosphate acyltransferase [Halioglobus sp.]
MPIEGHDNLPKQQLYYSEDPTNLPMKKWIAHWFLRLNGWTVEGERPKHTRFVFIAAPHTSNWDFVYMLAFATVFDVEMRWLAKHSLFQPPMGWIMRALGGIPIVRHTNSNVVADMVAVFDGQEALALAVPTEGTRALVKYWKSGFYHIAVGANVPIVPSYLDYGQKRAGFGPALTPTGDLRADMEYFRQFYSTSTGKFPEKFGPIRLREEDE